ncbi:hypothetical protein SaccyDRAFT_3785 [Saccharomonospora cyanea NA-134]|uniref:Uncharacterized protein n=1 Tax=Saccharomonospora cyanea NA-134 TaxID=882082 RepID=H5XG30_9PSEU|nr:hypothetical protein SaccyDRAFT_3785 [Saccharomonospora cyanea NA-134]
MIAVRRSLALAVVFALVLVVAAAAPPGPASSTTTPIPGRAEEHCDWDQTYHATLAMLGEDWRDWVVWGGSNMDGYSGRVDPATGVPMIHPDIPCSYVETVVVHEWLHLRQLDRYGSWEATQQASGTRLDAEMVAECGTELIVADPVISRRSYVEESERTRGYGCTSWHVLEAASLIAENERYTAAGS